MDENNNQEMQETLRQLKEGFDSLTGTLGTVAETLKKSADDTAKAQEKANDDRKAREKKADDERMGIHTTADGKILSIEEHRARESSRIAVEYNKQLKAQIEANASLTDSTFKQRLGLDNETVLLKKKIGIQTDQIKNDIELANLKSEEVQNLQKQQVEQEKSTEQTKKQISAQVDQIKAQVDLENLKKKEYRDLVKQGFEQEKSTELLKKQIAIQNDQIKNEVDLLDLNNEGIKKKKKELLDQERTVEIVKKRIERETALFKVENDLENLKKKDVQALLKKESADQKNLEKQQKAVDELTKIFAKPGASFKELADKNQSIGDVATNTKDYFLKLNEGSILVTGGIMAMSVVVDLVAAGLKGLYAGALSMTKSIYEGERGMSVSAKGVTALTKEFNKGIQSFGSLLIGVGSAAVALAVLGGPIGWIGGLIGVAAVALGGFIKVSGDAAETLAELNEIAAKQNDDLFKGFNELAKASMTGAGGMSELYRNLHAANMTVKEFEKFKTIIQAAGKDMKMFGVTAAEGIKTFAETSGDLIKSSLGRTLELMGIDQQDQREHTLKYMADQTRFGQMQGKSVADLAKGSGAYIEELDKLATLTGQNRKDSEDARNAIMAMENLRAGMMDAEKKRDDAKAAGNEVEFNIQQARLNKYQATERLGEQFQKSDPAYVKGLVDRIVSGTVSSKEAAQAQNMSPEVIKNLETGRGTTLENVMLASKENLRAMQKYASAGMIDASTEGLTTGKYGATADMNKRIQPMQDAYNKEKAAKGDKFDEDDFFKKFRVAEDDRTNKNVNLTRSYQSIALTLDDVAFDFTDAANINTMAADLFKKAVDKFAEATGYKDKTIEEKTEPKKSFFEESAAKNTQVQRDLEKPIQARVDVLNKQLEEDERALQDAKASGQYGDKLKPLEDKIVKEKEQYAKVASELVEQQKKTKEAALKEAAVRQKESHDKVELGRLEAMNVSDAEKIAKLNTKKADLVKEGKSTTSVDKDLTETKSGIAERTGKITALKSSAAPASNAGAGRGVTQASTPQATVEEGAVTDPAIAAKLIKFQGDNLGNKEHYDNLDPKAKEQFEKMITEYGKPIQINTAFRSTNEQAMLYRRWIREGKKGNPVAEPGTSKHESGRALDLNSDQVKDLDKLGLLSKYGFSPLADDPPHIQFGARDGGVFDGPATGYQVEMHNREAIVPLPNPNSIIKVEDNVDKKPLSAAMGDNTNTMFGNNSAQETPAIFDELYAMMEDKFNSLISKISDSNDIQDKLLKNSMV